MKKDYLIGTSGWQYADWEGRFYPNKIKAKQQLSYYNNHFNSVEVNGSFYKIPTKESVKTWYESVSADFSFTIKANRYFTHSKRLVIDDLFMQRIDLFFSNISPLQEKLACLLFQLPPSMKKDDSRIEKLAEILNNQKRKYNLVFDVAIEVRNLDWFNPGTLKQFRKLNFASVIIDSPNKWPASKGLSADFAYLRFHGSKQLYHSSYNEKELRLWADFIKKDCESCRKVFCYFNNDFRANATKDALKLKSLICS